jgi:protein-tyrosine kinase
MERLQAAIEKAREQRKISVPKARTPDRDPSEPGAPAALEAGDWAALPMPLWNRSLMRRHRVIALDRGGKSGSVDHFRTRILQMLRQNNWKRIAVTSPDKAAGKTTTCCNLLASLSHQPEIRSMLIDLDMRKPNVAATLGHKGEHSFWEVLEGKVPFEENAVRFADGAAVAMNYAPHPSPTELLLKRTTAEYLDNIQAVYQPDVMIFDLPPMLVTDDTLAFLKNVDCAIIVAGAETTTIDQVDQCEKDVADYTSVLGVILNKCRYMEPTSGYGYY